MEFSGLLFVVGLTLAACSEPRIGDKLYDRTGSVSVSSPAELEKVIAAMARAVKAPLQDRMQDLDDLPMFLLSNDEVVILLKHRAGEECDWSRECVWEYSLTATDTSLGQPGQQRVVDHAFAVISQLETKRP